MKTLLLGVLASFCLLTAAHTQEPLTPWEFVCTARGVSCDAQGIPEPQLVYFLEAWGAAGTYRPDIDPTVIMVNLNIDDPILREVVIVHEMSHYLDWHIGKLWGYEAWGTSYEANLKWLRTLCVSEGTAFWVDASWSIHKGYDEIYQQYDWLVSYPHCVNPEVYAAGAQ